MSERKDSPSDRRVRWPMAAGMFGYMLFVRLLPYLLYRLGVTLDPDITYYPWNLSPAFAVCLFSGACVADRRLSAGLPLATMLASDLGIWALTGRLDWAFYPWQFAVYLGLLICIALGFLLRDQRSGLRIAGAGLMACTAFFVVTNLAVWALGDTYPRTWSGLVECYVAAIPYFRNSLIGTAFFATILFSPLGVAEGQVAVSRAGLADQGAR